MPDLLGRAARSSPSGTVTVPGAGRASGPAAPAAWPRWGFGGGGKRRRTDATEDPDGKTHRYPTHHSVRGFAARRSRHSPELNPKENIWDQIREKIFKNYALKSIAAVYAKLEQAILYIERNPKLVRSITSFPYIANSL